MSKDPYRYFRVEAAELHERLSQGLLDLEEEPRSERVLDLLRAAHTLKGAARVVGLETAAHLSHRLEDQLAAWRDGARDEGLEPLFNTLDGIAAELRELPEATDRPAAPTVPRPATGPQGTSGRKPEPPEPAPAPSPAPKTPGKRRRETQNGELEELIHRTLMISARVVRSRRRLAERHRTRGKRAPDAVSSHLATTVRDELDVAVRELGELRLAVEDLRLAPATDLLTFLRRAARDLARSQGKQVVVELDGHSARFDADLARALRDPLLHAVTNAVTHGIPAGGSGKITVHGRREGTMLIFQVADDGPGLDLEAIRRAAERAGVLRLGEGEDWGEERLAQLAFRPGVTTAGRVDEVAGRGIGLDALRQRVVAFQGDVRFLTGQAARGTTLEIRVPFSTYAVPAIHATACGRRIALPLHSLVEVVRLSEKTRLAEELVLEDRTVVLGSLRRALHLDVETGCYRFALVLRHGQQQVALAVDMIHETAELAVFPLPRWTGPAPAVSGIGRGSAGEAIPMLSVQHLVTALTSKPGLDARPVEAGQLPILVVDDSLTSRMLQQSILEAAGFEVETAATPAEGLLRVAQRSFGLLLVDIEMPGMDGFTFLERTRDAVDPAPAMLISSRDTRQDRERGRAAGASAYIVKGEFDQPHFLELVRGLIRCP
ncbi:MAG: response regulator [Acidobacteria bacterium]|nr:response regulator [Acidobacteriota bacterium]